MSDNGDDIGAPEFWVAIQIWLRNPHVINRRLSGVETIDMWGFASNNSHTNNIIQQIINAPHHPAMVEDIKHNLNINTASQDLDTEWCLDQLRNPTDCLPARIVCVQKLIPRGLRFKEGYRICVLDLEKNSATLVNKFPINDLLESDVDIPYSVNFSNGDIGVKSCTDVKNPRSLSWLQNTLLPKLKKWASNKLEPSGIVDGSLRLVSLQKYSCKYQELKVKYGQEMVKVWPESTDPSKFVYEDVAIATYLLLLWEDERARLKTDEKQSFVDLGCGNGLLVYILSSEGHPGKGVDVRKRDIWDLYPEHVKLEVESITPSADYLYKNTNWIIGNHSDELTPWIPVIAARSSYDTNFFLLPCCAYEFSGKKYQRSNSAKSQYAEYIEYVKEICDICGIDTEIDRLKIPSTKRICLVGTKRSFERDCYSEAIEEIKQFIDSRCEKNISTQNSAENDCWVTDFKPRESVEKVRNCTKIERSIIDEIVKSVTTDLLKEKNYSLNSKWNAGSCFSLNDIVKKIPGDKLKLLKRECGGLQTLLRNHHHIFEVVGGCVKLRYPRRKCEVLKQLADKQSTRNSNMRRGIVLKKKPCWFFTNHPDGCPLSESECSYIHE